MQNKLPLAKDRNSHELMPDKSALLKGVAISSTPDSVDYFYEKLVKKLTKAGLHETESGKAVIALIKDLKDNVHAQRDGRANPYVPGVEAADSDKSVDKSDRVLSDFANFQKNLSKKGLEILIGAIKGNIKIDFAVSDESAMVRFFSEDGKELGPKEIAAMDKVLNYLLSRDSMVSKNGVIYESVDGKIKELDGKPVRADKEKIVRVLKNILPAFLRDNNLQASSQQHKFTEPAPARIEPSMPEPIRPPAAAPAVEAPTSPSAGVGSSR